MQVVDEVKKQSLILRLQDGSTDAAYFAAICILSIDIVGVSVGNRDCPRFYYEIIS